MAVVLVGVLAGCGGGGSKPGVSRAQYTAKAEAICRTTRAQAAPMLQQLAARASSLDARTVRRLAPLGRRIGALADGYLTQLAALEPPKGDRAQIERFVAASRAAVAGIAAAAGAAAAGQTPAVLASLQTAQAAATEANAIAGAYGLSDCSTVLSLG